MSDTNITQSAECETCGRRFTRWHSVKFEKICEESRHFAWDSGKYMGWCWRLLIGFWTVSFYASVPYSDKKIRFAIGRLL